MKLNRSLLCFISSAWLMGCASTGSTECTASSECQFGACVRGTCTRLDTIDNCGEVGRVCGSQNASAACVTAQCELTCAPAFANCNTDAADGCETSLHEVASCGACGQACAPPNATGTCSTGTCQISACTAGRSDCNGDVSDGCETQGACAPDFVVFGGLSGSGAPLDNRVYEYDASTQTFAIITTAGTAPTSRGGHHAAYDAARDRMVVFGGMGASGTTDGSVYALSFATSPPSWSVVTASGSQPGPRGWAGAAVDVAHHRLVLYGGNVNNSPSTELWTFDLVTDSWAQIAPQGAGPAARVSPMVSIDPVSGHLVVFGGNTWEPAEQIFDDVWTLDLDAAAPVWTQLSVGALKPAARSAGSLFTLGNSLVLVNGGNFDDAADAQMWSLTLTPAAWQMMTPPGSSPPARYYGATAIVGDTAYVFGGTVRQGTIDRATADLWAFTGATGWRQVVAAGTPGAPSGRYSATLIARPHR